MVLEMPKGWLPTENRAMDGIAYWLSVVLNLAWLRHCFNIAIAFYSYLDVNKLTIFVL